MTVLYRLSYILAEADVFKSQSSTTQDVGAEANR